MNQPPEREPDAREPAKKLNEMTAAELLDWLAQIDPEIVDEIRRELEEAGLGLEEGDGG
jgi:hypothetical protein